MATAWRSIPPGWRASSTSIPSSADWTRPSLSGLTADGLTSATALFPESVFITFQMTFAIITPALIVGAFAERMKFWRC